MDRTDRLFYNISKAAFWIVVFGGITLFLIDRMQKDVNRKAQEKIATTK